MTVTYLGTLATERDKVRFHLGDTAEDAGPRPADANFTDAEIDGLITAEGSWQRAVAAGFERLAAEWTRFPSFRETNGLSLNRSDIAKGYREQAETWGADFPRAVPAYVAGQITKDGYSDDVASDDVDTTGEYDPSFAYVVPA
jgi:hypothetical protein